MIIIVLFISIFLVGCFHSESSDSEKNVGGFPRYNISVNTISDENKPFQARSLEWGFVSENAANRFELSCDSDACSQWEIGFEVEGEIMIFGSGWVESGEYCFDYYRGQTQIRANPTVTQNVDLLVSYEVSACE